jgi:hypothetical protein
VLTSFTMPRCNPALLRVGDRVALGVPRDLPPVGVIPELLREIREGWETKYFKWTAAFKRNICLELLTMGSRQQAAGGSRRQQAAGGRWQVAAGQLREQGLRRTALVDV